MKSVACKMRDMARMDGREEMAKNKELMVTERTD